MSNYGAPFGDDADLERQLQEEYRRRQAMQQGGAGLTMQQQQNLLSRGGGGGGAAAGGRDPYSAYPGAVYGSYPGMGQGQQQAAAAASAYQHPHGPYTQVTNPYSGLAEARAAYARGNLAASVAGGADNDTPSAQAMYAQQLQQQQQQRRPYPQQQQSQQPQSQSQPQQQQQQQMYAYGGAAQQQRAGGMDPYSYGGVTGGGGMPPYRDYAPAPTAHLLAQQQHDPTDPYAALRSKPKPKMHLDDLDDSLDDGGMMGRPKKQMLQKVTSTINHKVKSSARIVIKDGTTVIEDGPNQWYTGCVPLGLEDDKYWLSELQVYLRANFAEAFGATEEDIAAPMHGRNKPIALGQVGIRCLHCKRKCAVIVCWSLLF